MKKETFERFKDFPQFLKFDKDLLSFEVGEGWSELLYKLFEDLAKVENAAFKISQVKQKFNRLRVYFTWIDSIGGKKYNRDSKEYNVIADLIDDAEERSTFICEDCGEPRDKSKLEFDSDRKVLPDVYHHYCAAYKERRNNREAQGVWLASMANEQ